MNDSITNQALVLPTGNNGTNDAVVLKDLKPLVDIPATWEWVFWIAVGLLLALLCYFLWKKWKQRQKETIEESRQIPPHIKARQKLLLAEDLIENPEPFCISVSEAVRTYLAERFNLHAPDRTTEEFLQELKTNPILQAEHQAILGEFLELCDLVKFARFEPQVKKLRDLLSVANRLIDETEPGIAEIKGESKMEESKNVLDDSETKKGKDTVL